MAIIKCKMCGGDLDISEGMNVAQCEYCGTRQTVPNVDSEKKVTLFGRAGRLRLACEFDKAAVVYENLVSEFPEEAEAYWGLVLCKYGIEYVDDPATGKKVPTCHRSSFESILEDSDFEQACENADSVARRVYREEAKAIEELRKGILEVSGKEPPYDIFICYKETDENGERTVDSVLAQDVYDALTEKGYRVFFSRITLEDKLGTEYEPYIFAALNSAKIMLVFGTDYEYFNAVWVKNEWSRYLKLMAGDKSKHLIPCYKDVDAYDMPKEFQKLQAQDLGKVGAVQDLLRGIDKLLGKGQPVQTDAPAQADVPAQAAGGPTVDALLKRGQIFLEDGDWDSAAEYFDKALDLNPECGAAYSGKLCCELKYHALAAVAEHPEQLGAIQASKAYQRAVQYGDPALEGYIAAATEKELHRLSGLVEQADTLSELHVLADALQKLNYRPDAAEQMEKCRKKIDLLQAQKIPALAVARARIAPAAGRIAFNDSVVIGVKTNGSVILDGPGLKKGYHNAVAWKNITAVAAGSSHILGLKANGTVVTAGDPGGFDLGQCELGDWNHIAGIAGGGSRSVGIKSDGTAVFKGSHTVDYSNMSSWTGLVAAASGRFQTVGLRSDGTVLTVGGGETHLNDADGWTDIVAVACGDEHTVGLRSDGTVVAVGDNGSGQCNVGDWDDIVAIAAGKDYTIGVKADGTVRTAGNSKIREADSWTELVAVSARYTCVAGLKADGTVVLLSTAEEATYASYVLAELAKKKKEKKKPDFDVSRWRLFRNIDALKEEKLGAASGEASAEDLSAARARIQCAANMLVAGGDRTNGSITIGQTAVGSLEAVGNNTFKECSTIRRWKGIKAILADESWAIGLKSNGTVVIKTFDDSDDDACIDTTPMKNVVAVAFGALHAVGLRKNGTVIAAGDNDNKQCDMKSWKNITAIACGWDWTVGLCADGTAVSTHNRRYEHEIDLSGWSEITAIAAGSYHAVGLKADGTVVATGTQLGVDDGQCDVESWSDVVQIICQGNNTIGLRSDGTVLLAGALLREEEPEERADVSDWRDIIALDCGYGQLAGLKADGTVVLTGRTGQCDVSDWRDIVAVAVGDGYAVGLRADGTVLATGDNQYGQCEVSNWKLFNSIDTLEQERAEVENQARKKREDAQKRAREEKENRRVALENERARLQAELPNIKGLFSGGKRKQAEARLAEIEAELKKL